ncbi:MAG TPA: oligopeptide transporter, OPT family [Steroidobacteraceae bacterium]|nr:oligopeptide transporter, OPT family [Steroidobacteraceae bacterium]
MTATAQLSLRAITLSIVLAMILAAANTYLGLFAGLTIASAIPAAVISMGMLRMLGGGTILENNIVATGASAAASIAAGVIFTIPALVILEYWTDFKYSWVLAIAGLGGILGVLFSVPLRRSLIIEQKLKFPEGVAAAEVLKAGANPSQGLKILIGAAVGGGLVKLLAGSGLRLIPDTAAAAGFVGKGLAYIAANLSPALLGVGYIVGLNVGILIVGGGIISWNIAIPLYASQFAPSDPAMAAALQGLSAGDAAYAIWAAKIRYMGVGAMLIGGIWAVISLRSSLLSGVKSGLAAARAGAGAMIADTERDLPMNLVLIGIVLFTIPLALLYQAIAGSWGVSVPMTIIMIVAGFVFCSVSAYMAGLIGSSNNPVSGITICTILFASFVLWLLMGRTAPLGPVAAIMIGAVVCCAAAVGGDNLQDLKCGQLVGATPWRQQVMLAIGAVSCALVMAPVLDLLNTAYGIGTASVEHPNPLLAPQATLMAAVATGMFGGQLPWDMVAIGIAIGIGIIILDLVLQARGSHFRAPVLAVAVGIYLPLEYTTPIFLGGLLAHFVKRARGGRNGESEAERATDNGVLFGAGMITGEALMGIVIAIPIVMTANRDVLALPESLHFGAWLGILMIAALGWWLYRVASRDDGGAARGQ